MTAAAGPDDRLTDEQLRWLLTSPDQPVIAYVLAREVQEWREMFAAIYDADSTDWRARYEQHRADQAELAALREQVADRPDEPCSRCGESPCECAPVVVDATPDDLLAENFELRRQLEAAAAYAEQLHEQLTTAPTWKDRPFRVEVERREAVARAQDAEGERDYWRTRARTFEADADRLARRARETLREAVMADFLLDACVHHDKIKEANP